MLKIDIIIMIIITDEKDVFKDHFSSLWQQLGWRGVFTSGLFNGLVKFLDEFSKDQRLHISAQNVEQFPVAQLEMFAHFF